MRPRSALLLVLVTTTLTCDGKAGSPDSGAAAAAGEGRHAVEGGRIWYKVSGAGTATPLFLVHGGPGFSSFYLKSLEELGDERPIVRYDQLGGGKSDTISDTTLFTLDRMVRELDRLRAHLGYERVHVLGHSFGATIAVEYYRAHPARVRSLILGGSTLDAAAYERHLRQLVTTLSDSAQRAIRAREADGNFDAPDYQAAASEFNARYLFRQLVQPDADSAFATTNAAMVRYMWGPGEFTVRGTLKSYDATPFLRRIAVPTLFTAGESDLVNPDLVRQHAALTPAARMVVIPGAGHLTTWEAPQETNSIVREFLRAVDTAAVRP